MPSNQIFLPTMPSSLINKRRVTFPSSPPLIRTVPNLSDTSDDEIRATWYGLDDFKKIKAEIGHYLKAARRASPNGDLSTYERDHPDDFCLRGLEHLISRRVLRMRKADKDAAIRAVLEEQSRQRTAMMKLALGNPSLAASISATSWARAAEDAIRAKSISATRLARNAALIDAQIDAAAARQDYYDNAVNLRHLQEGQGQLSGQAAAAGLTIETTQEGQASSVPTMTIESIVMKDGLVRIRAARVGNVTASSSSEQPPEQKK